jgi:type VI secretion system secreted protein Hcp
MGSSVAVTVAMLLAALILMGVSSNHAGAASFIPPTGLGPETTSSIAITGANGYPATIELNSWSWGATSLSAATGTPTGRVKSHQFVITKPIDTSSPRLYQACANGSHFPAVVLTASSPNSTGSSEFLTITLTNVLVTSVQWSSNSSGDGAPLESLTLNFTKIKVNYTTP